MIEPWETLDSHIAFQSRWVSLRQDRVRLPSGIVLDDYFVLQQPNFVKVFGYTAAGEVVFVRQYKHGIGRVVLELPAGFIEPGEAPMEAAIREMREETGYSSELRPAGSWVVDPTRTPTLEHVFWGEVVLSGKQRLDATEDIEVRLVPAANIRDMIASGEIETLSTIAAALYCLPLIGTGL